MKRNPLGTSGLEVSALSLGTMTWGRQNSADEAHAQIDLALDRGVNLLDAAEMYPVPVDQEHQGRTETIIGEWVARRPQNRERVLIATKIAGPGRGFNWIRSGKQGLDRANILQAVDDSLRRLRTDHVDLYQIHWPDRYVPQFGATSYDPRNERETVPIVEQLAVFAELVRAGKIRALGVSNETPWGVAEFSRIAHETGLPKVVSVQNAYNLLNRAFEHGLAEVSRHTDVGLLAYSPLAFGLLSGKYAGGTRPPGARLTIFESFGQRYKSGSATEAADAYANLARSYGLKPSTLALAFVRQAWFVKSAVLGATSVEQLTENLDSAEVSLEPALLNEIDAIQKRHGNPAP